MSHPFLPPEERPEHCPNSTCRMLGHEWHVDLSGTYRTCARSACHAAQRLVQGQWLMVSRADAKRPTRPIHSSSVVVPSSLF